jgi:hypothetical protein
LYQGEEAEDFGLVGRQSREDATEARASPHRAGRIRSSLAVAAGALVEDQVNDLQHRAEVLVSLLTARTSKVETGAAERLLGPYDALGNSRFVRQKGAGDLARCQLANQTQGERRARLRGQSRAASEENQAQEFIADIIVRGGLDGVD